MAESAHTDEVQSRGFLASCLISDFRREVDEICPLLGHEAAVVILPDRRFGTTCRSYLQNP